MLMRLRYTYKEIAKLGEKGRRKGRIPRRATRPLDCIRYGSSLPKT